MDRKILNLERAAALCPKDDYIRDRLYHELTRCGRFYDARKLIQQRMASRNFSIKDLRDLAELGRLTGFICSYPVKPSSLMNFSALFHSRPHISTEVEVEIGFAGIEGAGALMSVLALADFFGCTVSGLAGSGLHCTELFRVSRRVRLPRG